MTTTEEMAVISQEPVPTREQLTAQLAETNSALIGKIQELERSEQRFQSQEGATSQILWTTLADGRMGGIQSEWSLFTGQIRSEYLGLGWLNAVHPEDAGSTRDEWT